MVDPLSLVTAILTVVNLIGSAALTARQNKDRCMELARRAWNLGCGLPDYARVAGNNTATVHGLERLRDALDEAFTLIKSCQESCIMSSICSSRKAVDLDKVDMKITHCLSDISFFSRAPNQAMLAHHVTGAGSVPAQTYDYGPNYQAHHVAAGGSVPAQTYDYGSYYQAHHVAAGGSVPAQTYDYGPNYQAHHVAAGGSVPAQTYDYGSYYQAHHVVAGGSVPAQTYDYASYYQAQGAPYSTACVGFPPPQYATVNMQWIPAPAPYTPAPAPSGSNLSTFYTLPTVNKIFDSMFR